MCIFSDGVQTVHKTVLCMFQPDDVVNVAVDKINGLLESFMGINDTELCMLCLVLKTLDLVSSPFIFFFSFGECGVQRLSRLRTTWSPNTVCI